MKKYLIYLIFMLIMPLAVSAQSSMTDTQVMQYVMKAKEQGKSQSQIVTDLMQRGVDISQIRRVRNKYEPKIAVMCDIDPLICAFWNEQGSSPVSVPRFSSSSSL